MVATVVLVHGNFLGPWSWRDVVAGLADSPVGCAVADLPSAFGGIRDAAGDLHDDAAYVREVLDAVSGPVVLCGHLYGGAVIAEASVEHLVVRRLVYLAGALPDVGQSLAGLAPRLLRRRGNRCDGAGMACWSWLRIPRGRRCSTTVLCGGPRRRFRCCGRAIRLLVGKVCARRRGGGAGDFRAGRA
ncbi:alpha/beta fold hydrolase [Saccharopolyspora sp. NPDC000995]